MSKFCRKCLKFRDIPTTHEEVVSSKYKFLNGQTICPECGEVLVLPVVDFTAYFLGISYQQVKIPKVRKEGIEILDFVKDTNRRYISDLTSINSDNWTHHFSEKEEMLEKITNLSNSIEETIQYSINGEESKAYDILADAINLILPELSVLETIDIDKGSFPILYRMRFGKCQKRENLFHVPFEKKESAADSRFSVKGSPALYLGQSLFVCYEEFNKPDLNVTDISVAAFKAKRHIKLLNLSWNHKDVFLFLRCGAKVKNMAKSIITCWPLICACHIEVLYKEVAPIPEYIIPQLLRKFVSQSDKFDGIAYSSSKVKIVNDDIPMLWARTNYVFPVKKFKETGYCDYLMELFDMSEIKRFKDNEHIDFRYPKGHKYRNKNTAIVLDGQKIDPYGNHELCKMEGLLETTVFKPVLE